jgi:hypothetical protein
MGLLSRTPCLMRRAEHAMRETCRRKPALESLERRTLLSGNHAVLSPGETIALVAPLHPTPVQRAAKIPGHQARLRSHFSSNAVHSGQALGVRVHINLRHAVADDWSS